MDQVHTIAVRLTVYYSGAKRIVQMKMSRDFERALCSCDASGGGAQTSARPRFCTAGAREFFFFSKMFFSVLRFFGYLDIINIRLTDTTIILRYYVRRIGRIARAKMA